MSRIPQNYVERVYAGWLGKIIGVRHGGNVEQWSYKRIAQTFGEITGYLHQFKNFAADDDTNGTLFFLRALEDYSYGSELSAQQIGWTWLNYAPDGHGFFWWGGYGRSTEHTAYFNLKNGISAPRSGSIAQNGKAVAEQIGGQIFIDGWGLVCPGNAVLAAEYAAKAASVSHDGEGQYGAMFVAACVAAAFVETDIRKIIEQGLCVIPSDSEYTRVVREVMRFHERVSENWRQCFAFVRDKFGYDKYPGACHIIPNSAVIVLALLYGEGDFSRSINICNMCGWDTDCNVANVGTIMGVRGGLDAIAPSWRDPVHDFLCCSSVIGGLNIQDIPSCAAFTARFGYRIAGENAPLPWRSIIEGSAPRFHFEYPGSTHAFRTAVDADGNVTSRVENTGEMAADGGRALKIVFDKARPGYAFRCYYQTYYQPDDFDDSRYDPSFSPLLYPGQTVTVAVAVHAETTVPVKARLYVRDCVADRYHHGPDLALKAGEWQKLEWTVPSMKNVCVKEVGVEWIPVEGQEGSLICYIDDFDWSGSPVYSVDFDTQTMEHWTSIHVEIPQCTYLRGYWRLEEGVLAGSSFGEPAECYTGDIQWRNYRFQAVVRPKLGDYHLVQFRVQGGIRSYAVGLGPNQQVLLMKKDRVYRTLASERYSWDSGLEYEISVVAVENHFEIGVNGVPVLSYTDDEEPYLHGQVGFASLEGGHSQYLRFAVSPQ